MKARVFILACVMVCASTGAQDVEELRPTVSFSAWRVMSSGPLRMEGKYYYAPYKYRNEMELNGQKMTTIFREDLNTIWNLMPDMQFYMEVDVGELFEQGGGVLEGAQILEREAQGIETVNGYRTTKYNVTMRDALGATTSGLMWISDEMIPVKAELATQDGELVTLELTEIEIGPQPDSLFEVPAGYQKFSLGGLAGLAGAGAELPRGAGQIDAASGEDAGTAAGGIAQDVTDAVRDGVAEGARQGARQGAEEGVRERARRGIRGIFDR